MEKDNQTEHVMGVERKEQWCVTEGFSRVRDGIIVIRFIVSKWQSFENYTRSVGWLVTCTK